MLVRCKRGCLPLVNLTVVGECLLCALSVCTNIPWRPKTVRVVVTSHPLSPGAVLPVVVVITLRGKSVQSGGSRCHDYDPKQPPVKQ